MQTILGAGGAIADELARELHRHYTTAIRLVSRHPQRVNDTDQLVTANLLDARQTAEAVAGCEIAYLTVGLPLDTSLWQTQFPVIMQNVIAACKQHQTKLVFFDNTYMYPQTGVILTEDTPFAPYGPKGRVRAQIAQMLLTEMAAGTLTALICRAPEFYGPGKTQSFTNSAVFDAIRQEKKPRIFLRDDTLRTLIYTPDASRAMALIAHAPDAYGQTWHLPCDDNRLTYEQLIATTEAIVGRPIPYTILPQWQLSLLRLFLKRIRETAELLPRYRVDNVFVSDKFKRRFPQFSVTTYPDGIRAVLSEVR
ncbi:NAD-dependent epimerase/dehydratase family protein [Fibrella sp. WM1]|uniref:NAD-dependent epimerase/dehydratase family protein n=1 Tax=Fibrella musci TaxID=3242485 RepID=UPI00352150F9